MLIQLFFRIIFAKYQKFAYIHPYLNLNGEYYHCVKFVQIRSYFWSVFSCRTEYRKIRARNNSVFEHFSRRKFMITEGNACRRFNGVYNYNAKSIFYCLLVEMLELIRKGLTTKKKNSL